MDIFDALNMVGGLAMFLYGMNTMGGGLSKMAGGKLEGILERLTSKKKFAVLLGAAVTAVIQSSSATTVMVVGFVNSGIMQLKQVVGIIMGANIGTTVTSWILSLSGIDGSSMIVQLLKPSSFSPVLAAIGIILVMSGKGESKKKDAGEIMLGFAVLMFGMEMMSGSVEGLADNPSFTGLMTAFSNPLLGLAAGAILTAIIQSSSASVGILQALCLSGAVPFSVAIPIIMGQNIGTCVTSIISSIGATKNAKRAAMIHLYFNLVGTVIFMTLFYILHAFMGFAFLDNSASAAGIAVIHSIFNIGTTIMLYPFSNMLVRLAEFTISERNEEMDEAISSVGIDERLLERPAFAMEICRTKVREMAEHTRDAILIAMDVILDYDKGRVREVARLEQLVDDYEDVLGTYLVKLSGKDLSAKDSQTLSLILHSISDFERISDHAHSISVSAEEINSKNLEFSEEAKHELEVLSDAVNKICNLMIDAFSFEDARLAMSVEPLEVVIDILTKTIKERHICRLKEQKCSIEMGFILEDILNCLERVSDHCSNIALEMITILDNEYNTHEYYRNMNEEDQVKFDLDYKAFMKRYSL